MKLKSKSKNQIDFQTQKFKISKLLKFQNFDSKPNSKFRFK